MYKREQIILDSLSDGNFHSLEELAGQLKLSTKTVRNLINDINADLTNHGADIISKYKKGLLLQIEDEEKFRKFYSEHFDNPDNSYIPNTSEERIQYLLEYLFNRQDYVKIDDLCESLYISRRTLSSDIKEVENYINQFGLKIVRKSNHGIKIEGNEFDARICIASFLTKRTQDLENDGKQIQMILSDVLKDNNISIRGVAYQNLISHLSIAVSRVKKGYYVRLEDRQKSEISGTAEYKIAERIAGKLNEVFHITLPENEIAYIAVHLVSKEFFDRHDYENNIVITQEISDLVTEMLENIYVAFKFDFRDNLELRMMISQHLVPLIFRAQYNLDLKNPLLHDVKEKFFLAYTIACNAASVVNRHYNTHLSEDEIGYLAFTFALALERNRTSIEKKNIILVSLSGIGGTQLLTHKLRTVFKDYIDRLEVCDEQKLSAIDFSQFDYVFTTIPITEKVPIPILEVEYFLNSKDVTNVRKILSHGKNLDLRNKFPEDLFLPHLAFKDKESVLKFLCEVVINKKKLPESFYESVLEREAVAKTAFGNLIAMPHSFKAMSKETFVCIGILEEPIEWDSQKVQVIFLTSIQDEDQSSKNLQNFYQIIAKYSLNPLYIQELISEQDYALFIHEIMQIEENMEAE